MTSMPVMSNVAAAEVVGSRPLPPLPKLPADPAARYRKGPTVVPPNLYEELQLWKLGPGKDARRRASRLEPVTVSWAQIVCEYDRSLQEARA